VNHFAETLPAFLAHTRDEDLTMWGKISPPIRGERYQKRLWRGLRSGGFEYVGTDHCPTRWSPRRKEMASMA